MYPQFKKFTLMKRTETITTDSTGNNVLLADSSLPRLFIEENQEFIIEGQIFTWYFSNKDLRQGIVLNRKGMMPIRMIEIKQ